MKNFIIRTISGAVYVSIIIGSLLLDKSLFALVCLIFGLIGTYELNKFNPGYKPIHITYLIPSALVFVLFHLCFLGIIPIKWVISVIILPFILLSIELYKKQNNIFGNISYILLGYIYVIMPLIILDYLNFSSPGNFSGIVLCVFILVWANDSFAYITGMLFGKHKLFERMTPKKTWEGFAGGVIATVLISWLLYKYSGFESLIGWLVLGFIVAISSVFGDFVESMFKRSAGVKDSGNIMPGHGGILDRLDSVLFVFPVVFVYIKLIM